MFRRAAFCTVWIGLIALGAWLRFHDLARAPVHADEATGARIASERIEGGRYEFNPHHFHGPWLSYSAQWIAKWRKENEWADLTIITLRSGAAFAGLALLLCPLLWVRSLGLAPTLAVTGLLATSPLLVYYSRIHIHESWLALFGFLSLTGLYHLSLRPGRVLGILTGLCLGLMFATKGTFVISAASWAVAFLLSGLLVKRCAPRCFARFQWREIMASLPYLVVAAFLTAGWFYTDGLKNPAGVVDSVRTYFVYETTEGHEKPFGYYLRLLIWPKLSGGMLWTEGCVFILAGFACVYSLKKRLEVQLVSFLALASVTTIVIYSLISYKTPWLMALPWAQCSLLAAFVFYRFAAHGRGLRFALALALVGALSFQTKQSLAATGRLLIHESNPYAYVPTTRDPARLSKWLGELDLLLSPKRLAPVAVVGVSYWPLPWYLRDLHQVGYWPGPFDELAAFPVVLAMPEQEAACSQLLRETHVMLPRSLRANVSLFVYLREDLWQQWLRQPEE